MYCPFCQAEDTKVVDSRLVADGSQTRRRRSCEVCQSRFTKLLTWLCLELLKIMVKDNPSMAQSLKEVC